MRDQVKASERKTADLEQEMSLLRQNGIAGDRESLSVSTLTDLNTGPPSQVPDSQDATTDKPRSIDVTRLTELIKNVSTGQSIEELSAALAGKLDEILDSKNSSSREQAAELQEVRTQNTHVSLHNLSIIHGVTVLMGFLQQIKHQKAIIKDREDRLQQEKTARERDKEVEVHWP